MTYSEFGKAIKIYLLNNDGLIFSDGCPSNLRLEDLEGEECEASVKSNGCKKCWEKALSKITDDEE